MDPPMTLNDTTGAFKVTLDFAGFNREDVRIMLINQNQVCASGDRSKYPGFGREKLKYMFLIPRGADHKNITATFDGKTRKLAITITQIDEKLDNKDRSSAGQKEEQANQTEGQLPSATANEELDGRKEEQARQTEGQLPSAEPPSAKEQGPKLGEGSGRGKKNHEELLMATLRTILDFLKESQGLNYEGAADGQKSVDEARKDEHLVATAALALKLGLFTLEKLKSS